MGIGRPRAALVILTVASFVASASAASAFTSQDLIDGLTQLDAKVEGKSRLTPDERNALGDVASVGSKIKEPISRIRRGKAFGQKTTALRGFANEIASRDFGGAKIYGVPFSEHFRDLECADVKVEAGRVSGASACLHRLRRFVKSAG